MQSLSAVNGSDLQARCGSSLELDSRASIAHALPDEAKTVRSAMERTVFSF